MNRTPTIVTALAAGLAMAGCSTVPPMPTLPTILTSGIATGALPATAERPRGTPVRTNRAARLYAWAGFKEKDCSPVTPAFAISKPPAKGSVSLKRNQPTMIQFSSSGKCVGQKVLGTGVYYTAAKDQQGADQFSVTATMPSGQTVTRTFQVRIVEQNDG